MFFFSKKKNPHETCCFVCHIVVAVLLLLTAVAAFANVLFAHYNFATQTMMFGSNAGPLSLISFAVALGLWMHALKGCMSQCDVCKPNGKK